MSFKPLDHLTSKMLLQVACMVVLVSMLTYSFRNMGNMADLAMSKNLDTTFSRQQVVNQRLQLAGLPKWYTDYGIPITTRKSDPAVEKVFMLNDQAHGGRVMHLLGDAGDCPQVKALIQMLWKVEDPATSSDTCNHCLNFGMVRDCSKYECESKSSWADLLNAFWQSTAHGNHLHAGQLEAPFAESLSNAMATWGPSDSLKDSMKTCPKTNSAQWIACGTPEEWKTVWESLLVARQALQIFVDIIKRHEKNTKSDDCKIDRDLYGDWVDWVTNYIRNPSAEFPGNIDDLKTAMEAYTLEVPGFPIGFPLWLSYLAKLPQA